MESDRLLVRCAQQRLHRLHKLVVAIIFVLEKPERGKRGAEDNIVPRTRQSLRLRDGIGHGIDSDRIRYP